MAFTDHRPEQDLATRTKRIAAELTKRLIARTGLDDEKSARIASALLAHLGVKAGKKAGDTAYLLFFGRPQLEAIVDLVKDNATDLAEMDDAQLAAAVKDLAVKEAFQSGHPIDVALFGRMVADIPALNVDAATQVAHALSTHAVELEFDYYTAVDDENEKDETGAGMIGTVGFNSATLYRYATVSLHQLQENLGESDAAIDAIRVFVDTFARSVPSGHVNSFAHQTRPSLIAVVVREDQPVNLVSAFEAPIRPDNGIATKSAHRLATEYNRATRQWGDTPAYVAACHAFDTETPAGEALHTAFGTAQTFPDLLTGLRGHLIEHVKQN